MVLSLKATITVPFGTFRQALQTKETTPLEPDIVSNKWYARGIGEVAERDLKGGTDRLVLVSMTQPDGGGAGD